MKRIFIVNESAGRGKCKKIIPNIEKACKDRNIDFEIRYIYYIHPLFYYFLGHQEILIAYQNPSMKKDFLFFYFRFADHL